MLKLYNYILTLGIRVLYKIGYKNYRLSTIYNLNRILNINYKENKNFSFIQVGANDGISFDSLYEFVISRKSSGLVIEPINNYFNELVENYKEFPAIIKINKAIHSFEKSKNIYKIKESQKQKYPNWVKGIASFDKNHYLKAKISKDDIEEENVLADTFMNIISEFYLNKKIDYLQIDTEGYDLEILKMIDFAIVKPIIIKYENVHLEIKDLIESKKLLIDQGYSLFDVGYNTIGVDLGRIRLL